MNDSILITLRTALGVPADYDGFDTQIIMAANTALMSLSQLGIGPTAGYSLTGSDETWTELFDSVTNIEAVKSYIYLKTRLEFDPPTTAHLLAAIEKQIEEITYRLYVQVDPVLVDPDAEATV